MHTRAERRVTRSTKAWRRIKEDRNQHGRYAQNCACFGGGGKRQWGKTFARFADTPQACSCDSCGNPRRGRFKTKDKLTVQELRLDDYTRSV